MASTIPKHMRSLLQPSATSQKVILTTLPTPVPSPSEHLIRVHSTAITNGELLWPAYFPTGVSRTLIPCFDLAGTVVTAPTDSPFVAGSEVWGRTHYIRPGCGAEYTVAPASELAFRSKRLGWDESATVPMSAETAWQALFDQAGLSPVEGGAKGKKIFVTAASGGVGTWVVQLAVWAGADVYATASGDNVEFVKSLGAKEVLDYRKTDIKSWTEAGDGDERKVDLVVDCIGKKSLEDAWWVVKNGGTLISIFQPPEEVRPEGTKAKDVKNFFFIMDAVGSQLEEVRKLIDSGKFVTRLDSAFPIDKFEEAFDKLASGKTNGKVVLNFGVDK